MSNFIVFPHTEVSTDFIKIQTIAGIKTYFYWLTNVGFDALFSVLPMATLCIFLLLINQLLYNGYAFQKADIGKY